ncbi:MAG: hypothetical protein WBY44_16080 [Bryobacteraceae bacterium]
MARTAAILRALGRALRRDQKSIESIAGNNFFWVTVLLLQEAGTFIFLLFGLILLFPLSTDPLRKVPASRMASWPLETRERWTLRLASPWVNPMSWLLAAGAVFVARGKVSLGLWGIVAGLIAAAFVISAAPWRPRGGAWRAIPQFPGPLNHLVRKNLREMLATLDFYCALALSLIALAFRAWGRLPPEALLPMTALMAIALSSYAQCLFGLDGDSGMERYRLMPLRGWQVLAAKDAAYLSLAIPLALALSSVAGTAAALVAVAVGHSASVRRQKPQARWRFSAGAPLPEGLAQAALIAVAASAVMSNLWFAPLCVAAWAGSLWWYGRMWDRAE